MRSHLATDNDIRNFPVYEQLYEFAYAYHSAAQALCAKAVERAECRDWAAGSVVLMNASHAVELFLKAVLLKSDESMDVWAFGHDIAGLADEYERRFPEAESSWEILFRRSAPDNLTSEQEKLYKQHVADPSIEFRYPHARHGRPWITMHGFEPRSFAHDLDRIKNDFDRVKQYFR